MKAIRRRFPMSVASLFLLAMVPTACGGGGSGGNNYITNPGGGGGSSSTVAMDDNNFSPKVDTVSTGTTVTWKNDGANYHTSTSDTGLWDSGQLGPGQTYSYEFATAGSYPYHCTNHGAKNDVGMAGTIVVK